MNSSSNIKDRNKDYLQKKFYLSDLEWTEIFKKIGPPIEKYADKWNANNPTSGWCGGVVRAVMMLNLIPEGYVVCRQKNDPHYYFINPNTTEVIDLTIYQMEKEYEHDYVVYKTDNLFNDEVPENVIRLVKILKNIKR